MMSQNIILLKSNNARTRVVAGQSPTFAGNIGEMFHTEFFMETTIGEFARRNLESSIKTLDNSPTIEDCKRLRKVFANVGDTVLKNLLIEKLQNAENSIVTTTKR